MFRWLRQRQDAPRLAQADAERSSAITAPRPIVKLGSASAP